MEEVDTMGIKYKLDILEQLREAGYSTYRLRKEKLLPEGTIQHLRDGTAINFDSLSRVCKLLGCQPGDLIEYIDE